MTILRSIKVHPNQETEEPPEQPQTCNHKGTTNHDAAFVYGDAGDVLHDDTGRSFTYDALSMTTGAIAPLSTGGTRNFACIYTADDERIALVEELNSGGTTTNWTLRGLNNHLLRTWTNSSTSGWSWREDDIWRGEALLAYESPSGVRHYGLDHLGSPAIVTDALGHPVGPITFDAFGNGGATGAGMLQYTAHEWDSFNVGPSPGTVTLPDYLHARYYDPARGRFLSVDPNVIVSANLRMPQRWNRYAYVGNSPLGRVDLDGREWFAVIEYGSNTPLHEAIVWIDMKTGSRGAHTGEGLALRETDAAGNLTGTLIRFHPGGGHHGPFPYWVVSSPGQGTIRAFYTRGAGGEW